MREEGIDLNPEDPADILEMRNEFADAIGRSKEELDNYLSLSKNGTKKDIEKIAKAFDCEVTEFPAHEQMTIWFDPKVDALHQGETGQDEKGKPDW